MARVLKARYFPDGDILTATMKKKASYAWKSILHGRDLLTKGMRYIIGDGSHVNMWTDQWLPVHPPRPPIPRVETMRNAKVGDFIAADRNSWNEQRLRDSIVPEDVERILSIKISAKAHQDLLGWHYNDDGIYSVKSGYWLGTHLPTEVPALPTYGNPELKHKIWKTKAPSKLKHFLWRMISRSLATGNNLERRHISQDTMCKRCFMAEETEDHLFFGCIYAQRMWRASGISNLVINNQSASLEEKIEACLQICSSTQFRHYQDLPLWILWRLWKSRNLLIFQKHNIPWSVNLSYARNDAQEWKSSEVVDDFVLSNVRRESTDNHGVWKRPPQDWIKCNTDGSFHNSETFSQAGWVLRDANGTFRGAVQAVGKKVQNSIESELQSILMAIQHCWSLGHRKVLIEGDNKKSMEILNNKKLHFGAYNWIREIRWWVQQFEEIKFQWICRDGNRVADSIARRPINMSNNFVFHAYVPSWLDHLLHADYVNSI